MTQQCTRCKHLNPADACHCMRCGHPVTTLTKASTDASGTEEFTDMSLDKRRRQVDGTPISYEQ